MFVSYRERSDAGNPGSWSSTRARRLGTSREPSQLMQFAESPDHGPTLGDEHARAACSVDCSQGDIKGKGSLAVPIPSFLPGLVLDVLRRLHRGDALGHLVLADRSVSVPPHAGHLH